MRTRFSLLWRVAIYGVFVTAVNVLATVAALPPRAWGAEPVEVRFLRASSTGAIGVGESLMRSESKFYQSRDDAEFVRLSWFFERPVRISGVRIESCSNPFEDGADVIINTTEYNLFVEGGKTTLTVDLKTMGEAVHSLSINFRHTHPVCVKGVRLFQGDAQLKLSFHRPVATILPPPNTSENASIWRTGSVVNLFDSRPETNWMPSAGAEKFLLEFDRERKIERVRIWNGDQRSGRDFNSSGRVERLSLRDPGRDDAGEVIVVNDAPGMQEIKLKKAIETRKLYVHVDSVHAGANAVRPAISEMRFVGSDGVFAPASDSHRRESESHLIDVFSKSGLAGVLDRDLTTLEEDDVWHFRFRADGTFFVRGFADQAGRPRAFQGTGTFDIVSGERGKAKLRVSGIKVASAVMVDGDSCFLGCVSSASAKEEPIDDQILLERSKAGKFMLRNRTAAARRTLPFGDMRVKITSLHE